MSSLREIQESISRLVRAPEGVAAGLSARGAPAASPPLDEIVRSDARLDAVRRLDIYANAYFYRILGVLEEDFPGLAGCLGKVGFHDLVTSYLLVEPPHHPSLRYAGLRLAGFLATSSAAQALRERHPWASDLATFEWSRVDVFDAPDEVALERDQIGRLAPEAFAELNLTLGSWAVLRTFDFEVDQLWSEGLRRKAAEQAHASAGPDVSPPPHTHPEPLRPTTPNPTSIILWRKNERVLHRRLDGTEESALAMVSLGASFAALCEWAADASSESEGPGLSAGWLEEWLRDGLLRAD